MRVLVATANTHKVREICKFLGERFELLSLRDFPALQLPEETGETMRENARLKARHCADASGLPSLADDSGIEVDALDGRPGVLSARWQPGSDADRTRALLRATAKVPLEKRTARYRCAICLAFPDGAVLETEATCEGRLAFSGRGENGFGYDPVFEIIAETGAPAGFVGQTMAEAPPEVKASVSHRARALGKLLANLR